MLQAVLVIDYQNVHLSAHDLFSVPGRPRHESLIHPLHFAQQFLQCRNQRQRPGMAHAELGKVLVYRGLPAAEHDPDSHRRNQAQKAHWERDRRVQVTLRSLKYRYQYDAAGRPASDAAGRRIVVGSPKEKGIDVLCALALVREAREADLVVLASQDTDLIPALDEAMGLKQAKIETVSWYAPQRPAGRQQLRPGTGRIWNTQLGETEFSNCQDRTNYT
jgi:hypothetical protein